MKCRGFLPILPMIFFFGEKMPDAYLGPRGSWPRVMWDLHPLNLSGCPERVIAEGLPGTRPAYFWEPLWPVGCCRIYPARGSSGR